ncbi:hypothetical protein WN944_024651 [Citrus x changshan-huyou]|uniref:Uncharacterized protein n=1 Tax=Citrus x changshan-huyou TaxID=2935761 RepID=A0AAP0LPA9_9ROSI
MIEPIITCETSICIPPTKNNIFLPSLSTRIIDMIVKTVPIPPVTTADKSSDALSPSLSILSSTGAYNPMILIPVTCWKNGMKSAPTVSIEAGAAAIARDTLQPQPPLIFWVP